MNKTIYLKTLILLWGLMVGIGGVSAQGVIAEWVETDYSGLKTGDVVVLVDEWVNVALPNRDANFEGVNVTISNDKISGTVPDGIQWSLRKNDNNTVSFFRGNTPLSVTAQGELRVGSSGSSTHEFTNNNGMLSCQINNKTYYDKLPVVP